MPHMKRREFIALLGGAAASWPLAARAQAAAKSRTTGFLGSATPSTQGEWNAAFVQHMRELGWIEGRTVRIEFRWAEGRNERYAEIAAEFVRLNVDVIVTVATSAVLAAKQATSTIPIVFAGASDPVGSGLVKSLAPRRQHYRLVGIGARRCNETPRTPTRASRRPPPSAGPGPC